MANKITEKTVAASVKAAAHVLITQPETVEGVDTEALRRVTLAQFASAIRDSDTVRATVAETKTYLGIS